MTVAERDVGCDNFSVFLTSSYDSRARQFRGVQKELPKWDCCQLAVRTARIFLFTTTTMDPPLAPPVRIQAISSMPITTKEVRKSVEKFLDDLQSRTTSAQGGNTAVTVQLQKLANALKEERKLRREKDKKTQL